MKSSGIISVLLVVHYEIRTIKNDGRDEHFSDIFFEKLPKTRLWLRIVIVIKAVVTESVGITNSDTILPESKVIFGIISKILSFNFMKIIKIK